MVTFLFIEIAKESKQVPLYQWHSLVPYWTPSKPANHLEASPKKSSTPVTEPKAAKKMVTLQSKRPTAIHQSISDNSESVFNPLPNGKILDLFQIESICRRQNKCC